MPTHFNIQINIQRVTTEPVPAGAPKRGVTEQITGQKRDVLDMLKLSVTAETEIEAYDKIQRMLTANHPDVQVVPAGVTVGADSAGRYRPIRDNPQA